MQKQKEIVPSRLGGTTLLVGIMIIVAAAIILFGGVFAYQYYLNLKENKIVKNVQNEEFGYYIKFQYDENFSDTNWNKDITEYISDILNIPENDYSIFYDDSREMSNFGGSMGRFNRNYYIILDSVANNINIDKIYKKDGLSITIEKVDQKLLPFIKNSEYCQNDSDCVIRFNNCAYGSFNNFSKYFNVMGCEGAIYAQEDQNQLSKLCDQTKQYVSIKYSSSKCINNKCSPINRKVSCEEGILP